MFGPLFKRNNKTLKQIGLLFLSFLFILSFTFTGLISNDLFKASSLVNIKHAPFDGLVFPYSHGVDWVRMSGMGVDRMIAYNEVPSDVRIEPLIYNARELAIPVESLGFTNPEDIRIRNSKITYTVPYMGTYNLDGVEGAGSHPGVDIALPIGTPVIAIGNGVVVKAEDQEWGFGKHVVLRHNDFPSFDDPNVLTTYFSSYSHMDSIAVNVGDVVRKGQLLGTVGMSGTASTPHIHFQIDKNTAPWHPFWPFSATEARNEGVSFTEAVNIGLGRDVGYEHTINPMVYIQRYFSPVSGLVADAGQSDTVRNPDVESTQTTEPESEIVSLTSDFVVDAPNLMILNSTYEVLIKTDDNLGGRIASLSDNDFNFRSNLISSYTVPRILDFTDGSVSFSFTPKELGNMNMIFTVNDRSFYSDNVEVRIFPDVLNNDADLKYIKDIKDLEVINGYPDGSFQPDRLVNKAEAAKFVVNSLPDDVLSNLELVDINFSDVNSSDWYFEYVQILASLNAIDTDRPEYEAAKPVNLAELLKLIYVAHSVDVNPVINEDHSENFQINEWYSPYLQIAVDQELIDYSRASSVSESQLRRDVSRIIARLIDLSS